MGRSIARPSLLKAQVDAHASFPANFCASLACKKLVEAASRRHANHFSTLSADGLKVKPLTDSVTSTPKMQRLSPDSNFSLATALGPNKALTRRAKQSNPCFTVPRLQQNARTHGRRQ